MHLRLPVMGFRFGNFSYITDANFISDETLEKLAGTEILVLNALQVEPHISHFNLKEAIAMAGKIKAKRTYFTHASHKLGLHASVTNQLPDHISLAYDGLQITMN
jgi:phosphoribosyl 1,2-cyclic phosphate phosphodiesterase